MLPNGIRGTILACSDCAALVCLINCLRSLTLGTRHAILNNTPLLCSQTVWCSGRLFRDRALREEEGNEDVMATQKLGVGAGSTTLVNKAPHWNEQLRCWCLNFKGRVKLASVKNFQLVCENDLQTIVMQVRLCVC